ncbi:MAG: peptide deformylase [Rickettsiales bacterium]|nr:peptide deformylase [Rickettsiales bacterium]|tara:strand:+ start:625 stop:1164 length:540 start_codon:yes stop_codon:yes gene_type:complete
MTILKILTIPDPRLKHKSSEVKSFDKDLKVLVKDMYDTLYGTGNGIGLAAPQIGVKKRIVIIDLKEDNKSKPITLINPKITKKSEEKFINEEGCLSVPEYFAEVERSQKIEYEWYDVDGIKKKSQSVGLLSVCIQHEIDHLDGILFIDHLSNLKRKLAIERLTKLKKKTIREVSKIKNG